MSRRRTHSTPPGRDGKDEFQVRPFAGLKVPRTDAPDAGNTTDAAAVPRPETPPPSPRPRPLTPLERELRAAFAQPQPPGAVPAKPAPAEQTPVPVPESAPAAHLRFLRAGRRAAGVTTVAGVDWGDAAEEMQALASIRSEIHADACFRDGRLEVPGDRRAALQRWLAARGIPVLPDAETPGSA